jgi:NAD(P)-dependent dehydrogenase (short-subunit alcohol dehydrogenase family)
VPRAPRFINFPPFFIPHPSKAAACASAISAAVAAHGQLDGLVVATGIWCEGETHAAEELDYDRTMAVNVKGPFFLLSRALPHLKSSRGWATLLSSDAGIQGNRWWWWVRSLPIFLTNAVWCRGAAIYCASKGAVSNMVGGVHSPLQMQPFTLTHQLPFCFVFRSEPWPLKWRPMECG